MNRASAKDFLPELIATKKGYEAMLVLSRKKNESIVIADTITITVVEFKGGRVKRPLQIF